MVFMVCAVGSDGEVREVGLRAACDVFRRRYFLATTIILYMLYTILVTRGSLMFSCRTLDDSRVMNTALAGLNATDLVVTHGLRPGDPLDMAGSSLQSLLWENVTGATFYGPVIRVDEMDLWLREDPEVPCFVPSWTYLGLGYLLVYVLGIPLGFLVAMHFTAKAGTDHNYFAFLLSGYRRDRRYWELWVMLRKAITGLIIVLLAPVGITAQITTGCILVLISLVLHTTLEPYVDSVLQRTETWALMTQLLTLIATSYWMPSGSEVGHTAKVTLAILLTVVNVSTVAWLVFGIVRGFAVEAKGTVQKAVATYRGRRMSRRIEQLHSSSDVGWTSNPLQAKVARAKLAASSVAGSKADANKGSSDAGSKSSPGSSGEAAAGVNRAKDERSMSLVAEEGDGASRESRSSTTRSSAPGRGSKSAAEMLAALAGGTAEAQSVMTTKSDTSTSAAEVPDLPEQSVKATEATEAVESDATNPMLLSMTSGGDPETGQEAESGSEKTGSVSDNPMLRNSSSQGVGMDTGQSSWMTAPAAVRTADDECNLGR